VGARRDQRQAGHDHVAGAGLANFHGTQPVEPLCERRGEVLGHVLDDHGSGSVDGQLGQDGLDRLGPAGRGLGNVCDVGDLLIDERPADGLGASFLHGRLDGLTISHALGDENVADTHARGACKHVPRPAPATWPIC